jgi:acetyltransferase-like isoleucine patch superfamily enzyme
MRQKVEIVADRYTELDYRFYDPPRYMRWTMKTIGLLSLPFIYPLILLSKISSESGFKMASELLSLLPTAVGVGIRYEFYRRTIRSCGRNVVVFFGAVLFYPEVNIGNNVGIGSLVRLHHCDIGDDSMISTGTHILSGSKYHHYSRTDIPINRQGGMMRRVVIGRDVWIGINCVIMNDVGEGAIVGSGSVVTHKVEPYTIVAGNPAKVIKRRVLTHPAPESASSGAKG